MGFYGYPFCASAAVQYAWGAIITGDDTYPLLLRAALAIFVCVAFRNN
jgi:hypothetical protein